MDTQTSKPIHVRPSFYAYCFEALKAIAKDFGYNLVLHGSMARDLDLIAIPWVDNPKDEFEMIQRFALELTGTMPETKADAMFSGLPGGRNSYVVNLNRGGAWNHYEDNQYYLDISVTPFVRGGSSSEANGNSDNEELDWREAKEYLYHVFRNYRDIGAAGIPAMTLVLTPLRNRFESGERTKDLYDSIMSLE